MYGQRNYADLDEIEVKQLQAKASNSRNISPRNLYAHYYEKRNKEHVYIQTMRETDENNNNITILHRVVEEDSTVHLKKTAKRKLFKDSSETNVKRQPLANIHNLPELSKQIQKKRPFNEVFEEDIEYDHKRIKTTFDQDDEMNFEQICTDDDGIIEDDGVEVEHNSNIDYSLVEFSG